MLLQPVGEDQSWGIIVRVGQNGFKEGALIVHLTPRKFVDSSVLSSSVQPSPGNDLPLAQV